MEEIEGDPVSGATRYGDDPDYEEPEESEVGEVDPAESDVDPREDLRDPRAVVETPAHEMVLKLFMSYFKAEEYELREFFPRREPVIDLKDFPTRRENLGYLWVPTEEERKQKVPSKLREVPCPMCGTVMTVLKSKPIRKWGDTVTYQCHAVDPVTREQCLTVVSVTLSCPFFLRPGDFTRSDYDWGDIAEQGVLIPAGARVLDQRFIEELVRPVEEPPSPYQRNTLSNVMWKHFWQKIMEKDLCSPQELFEICCEKWRQGQTAKGRAKINRYIDTIPVWMTKSTGYVVKLRGNVFRVVGRTRGDLTRYPYSDEEYRKRHGF